MHPVQLHIRDLVQEIVNSNENRAPLKEEWCDCEELRARVRTELHELGVEEPQLLAE